MKNKTSAVILIFNSKQELALQLRSAVDDSYASHWDFSAAGGINPGEDHETAAHRELQEELGIDTELEFMGEKLYSDEMCTDQLYIYRTVYNGNFQPDPDEVADVKFFSKEKIEDMVKNAEKFHPEFKFLWDKRIIF